MRSSFIQDNDPIIFHDILIIVPPKNFSDNYYGEYTTTKTLPHSADTEQSRLYNQLEALIEHAALIHKRENCNAANELLPDKLNCVTRLSTPEFTFFTSKPLSINEFEMMMQKITDLSQRQTENLHLVLGSFSVLNENDQVMNVVPCVSCGKNPVINLIVKNLPHRVDPLYKNPYNPHAFYSQLGKKNEKINGLPTFENRNKVEVKDLSNLSGLHIGGKEYKFTFTNYYECKTAGKQKYTTGIDICSDHVASVFKDEFLGHLKQTTFAVISNQPTRKIPLNYSHMILSSVVLKREENSLGNPVHVDPMNSWIKGSQKGVSQKISSLIAADFGGPFQIIDVTPTPCDHDFEYSKENLYQIMLKISHERMNFDAIEKRLHKLLDHTEKAWHSTELSHEIKSYFRILKMAIDEKLPYLTTNTENLARILNLCVKATHSQIAAGRYYPDTWFCQFALQISKIKNTIIENKQQINEVNKRLVR